MEAYQAEFIEFMLRAGVLTFGDFVTKSGRKTPYFFNTGKIDSGAKMARLGEFYARALIAAEKGAGGGTIDCLFGPAYKGIPLVVAAAIALARDHGRDVPFAFNRKETKDHGEGGAIVGHKLKDGERVMIVEDVTTAGTSVRESMELLAATAKVKVTGLIVSIDRQEKGQGELSALDELRGSFGIDARAIVKLDDVVEHLHGREIDGRVVLDDRVMGAIRDYRALYGSATR